jgi:hypothetical protein
MEKIILTMTTIPDRLHHKDENSGVRPGLLRLLNLTYPNYEIHFNIPYIYKRTGEVYNIPDWLNELEGEKLKIYRTDDYGPATKVVPTLFRLPETSDQIIISVEDDLYYMDGFIEYHLKSIEKYPKHCLGFAGLAAIDGSCHFCTTTDRDVRVKIMESYKTISYRRNFFKSDFFSEFLGKSWNDDIMLSAYFGKHNIEKIVLNYEHDVDFSARVESFPCIGHVPNEQSGCFHYRIEGLDDNSNEWYKIGYLER